MPTTQQDLDRFEHVYNEANAAGRRAANAHNPRPMGVSYRTEDGPRTDIITDGVCGFAWVVIKPGTHPFVRWLKSKGLGHKHYAGGWEIWIGDYNQSMEKKAAHAGAMALRLREAFPDLRIYSDSRMD